MDKYEVTVEFKFRVTYAVIAENVGDAEDKALEVACFDDLIGEEYTVDVHNVEEV
jgi:hypothetical protein